MKIRCKASFAADSFHLNAHCLELLADRMEEGGWVVMCYHAADGSLLESAWKPTKDDAICFAIRYVSQYYVEAGLL